MDWKDMLGQLRQDLPEGEEPSAPAEDAAPSAPAKKETLHVVVERKGRKGKTATIIEGFTSSDETVAEVAASLKKKLGCGGSSRGGEILIQGDERQRCVDLLKGMGYKVKG